ncbi:MAG: hypothetical protein R2860_15535 [Desulfobacterales bacterium]
MDPVLGIPPDAASANHYSQTLKMNGDKPAPSDFKGLFQFRFLHADPNIATSF